MDFACMSRRTVAAIGLTVLCLSTTQAAEFEQFSITGGYNARCDMVSPGEVLFRTSFTQSGRGFSRLSDAFGQRMVFNGQLSIRVVWSDGTVRGTSVASSPDRPEVEPVDVSSLFSNGRSFPPGPDKVTVTMRAPGTPTAQCIAGSISLSNRW